MAAKKSGTHDSLASPLGVPSPLSLSPSGQPEHHTSWSHVQPAKAGLNIRSALTNDTPSLDTSDVEPLSLPSVSGPEQESSTTIPHNSSSSEEGTRARLNTQLPSNMFQQPTVVTASAILSRSGHLHPISRSRSSRSGSLTKEQDLSYFTAMKRTASANSRNALEDSQLDTSESNVEQESALFASLPAVLKDLWYENAAPGNDKQQKARQHTGSALEAIGALFLRQDSGGRLDQLSLQRNEQNRPASYWPMSMSLWLAMFETRSWMFTLQKWSEHILTLLASTEDHTAAPPTADAPSSDEELPPTPVAMPGSYAQNDDDGLLLPPPFLDERSDPRSFEGLLGVRRMREQQLKKKRLEALRERNRPAHRVDMLTAFSNFVRSAKASDKRHVESKAARRRRFGLGVDLPSDIRKDQSHEETLAALRSPWIKPPFTSNVENLTDEPASKGNSHATATGTEVRPRLHRRATESMCGKTSLPSQLSPTAELQPSASCNSVDATMLTSPESLPSSPRYAPTTSLGPEARHAMQPTHRLTPLAMLDRATSESLSNSPATSKSTGSGGPSSRQATPAVSTTVPAKDADLSTAWLLISCVFVGATFVPDFIVFLLAHLLDFSMDVYEMMAQTLWFLRWLWLNGTGQTVLGRCIYEAYCFFQAEWAYVAREDHEARGERRRKLPGIRESRGLSAFQVIRGFLELACIQAVTRERYQEQGAGLELLRDWRRKGTAPPTPAMPAQKDLAEDDEDDDKDDLVVTSRTNDILEISRTLTKVQNERRPSLTDEKRYDVAYGLWNEDNAALVRNVKWASQLAMSAYGLQVLIVDLPPVFTPSGRQFPQQTFAHLSRLDADDVLHADIQALDMEATYTPTFYIVRDMRRKVVCVAVRGTQSFADIVVDLDMRTEDITSSLSEWRGVELESHSERYAYHAGIWRAARELVKPGSTLFTKLCDTLNEHQDFGLVFVGHSLGGAIASAASILLSEYHVDESDPNMDPCKGIWRTSGLDGFPEGRRIRAITFAHPSVVSNNLSTRTSFGAVPLVTTLILGSDIIPRFGHGQVRELRRVLGALTRVRRRRAMTSTTISSNPQHAPEHEFAVVHVLRRYWDWLSICRNDRPDAVELDRKRRLEDLFWRLRCEVEDDLYSQAKRRFDEAYAKSSVPTSPWVRAQDPVKVPLHTLSTRRQRLDNATLSSETAVGGLLVPAGRILWLEKGELYNVTSPMSFFGLPDLKSTMFLEHFPAAYEEAILALGRTPA